MTRTDAFQRRIRVLFKCRTSLEEIDFILSRWQFPSLPIILGWNGSVHQIASSRFRRAAAGLSLKQVTLCIGFINLTDWLARNTKTRSALRVTRFQFDLTANHV